MDLDKNASSLVETDVKIPMPKPGWDHHGKPTEIVIGLVGPLGVDMSKVAQKLSSRLEFHAYTPYVIRVARDIIPTLSKRGEPSCGTKFEQYSARIDAGNALRSMSGNNAILAVAAAKAIRDLRGKNPFVGRRAYIVSSLKHPDEVAELRRIYGEGFYLIAVHSQKSRRLLNLTEQGRGMGEDEAERLIQIDEHEADKSGQHTRDTFHLADFFVADENLDDKLQYSLNRCLDLIFGNPFLTPTFNEFAMFMAFSASLRSADLSRQVGAVVTKDNEILSTGANDCPRAGGGLYWPVYQNNRIVDVEGGRDYTLKKDSNSIEKAKIIDSIVAKFTGPEADRVRAALKDSRIGDITEYGRVVHAEMEAILACARRSVSCRDGKIFCTTFPCHNCAKHIIAAGIKSVVYIEPYPKSKALEFHGDSVMESDSSEKPGDKVLFQPFIGVGPRRFFDLFSMSLGSGRAIERKTKNGEAVEWKPKESLPRVPMLPTPYHALEIGAATYVENLMKYLEQTNATK